MGTLSRACLLLGLVATTAAAEELATEFKSPSGNILCSLSDYDNVRSVRCDIIEKDGKVPIQPAPADCEDDWGNMFTVPSSGPAALECAGDLVANPESAKVLKYGDVINKYGITCQSEKAGMTCINRDGHGFIVSRATQKLF